MPKTVEKPQQKQIDLVQTLFCIGMTLKSGQDAAKMRQDGPDEPSGPFLNAKMASQNPSKWNTNWPKKQQKKKHEKRRKSDHDRIIATRKLTWTPAMQSRPFRPPTPSVPASPGETAHIYEIPSLLFGGKPPSFPAIR